MAENKRNSRTAGLEAEAVEVKDSRGRPTVRVTLTLGNISGVGDVPAGASKGADEAQTLPVKDAIANIKKVMVPLIRSADADLRRHDALVDLERQLIEQAGDNFETLGANAMVPVSRALWQLAAGLRDMSLCRYIRQFEPELASKDRVHFYMNIFNGGLHALKEGEELGRDRIDIQEIMIVPTTVSNYREALQVGERIDVTLKDMLVQKYGADRVTRADEAGFSVAGLGDSGVALTHVVEAIGRAGYGLGQEVKLALDIAAGSFYEDGHYLFHGTKISGEAMGDFLVALVDSYPGQFLSIEDGLHEDDWDGWGRLSEKMRERKVLTIGDDLFVTQIRRLRRGVNNTSAHAILIKVNQNGSMTGTIDVMKYAKQNGLQCVVSHRSGETLDDSIADLAMATGALGLKSGDPQPEEDFPDQKAWVRRRKYLRMIALEETGGG